MVVIYTLQLFCTENKTPEMDSLFSRVDIMHSFTRRILGTVRPVTNIKKAFALILKQTLFTGLLSHLYVLLGHGLYRCFLHL